MNIMLRNSIALYCCMLVFPLASWSTGLKQLCRLPVIVEETSGIELTGKNQVWTLNDSGGESELYLCDTLGNLLRTVKINGAVNNDWEDLTQDDEGNFYIGNMGNNGNNRQNLCIYKIPNPATATSDEVDAQTISFRYEDQSEFPPSDNLNFDCEAIIWLNNKLYLFTKDRSFPITTNVYRLADEAGDYVAEKIGSFATGGTNMDENSLYSYWVTAADISPNKQQLVLLSHDRVWLFYNFTGDDFFGGDHKVLELGTHTQKESICFEDNATLYITDEYYSAFDLGRNLYKLTIDLSTYSNASLANPDRSGISLAPNPFSEKLQIEGSYLADYRLQLVDLNGKNYAVDQPQSSSMELNLGRLPSNMYYLRFIHKDTGDGWTEKLVKQ